MSFLGKYNFTSGNKVLALEGKKLKMAAIDLADPAAQFLAESEGNTFTLKAANGEFVFLGVMKSPNAFYDVLDFAGTSFRPSRFHLSKLNLNNQTVQFFFTSEDDGKIVSLGMVNGINPYCNCEFDVGGASTFGVVTRAPGVLRMQQTKVADGADFSCFGNVCVSLADVDLSGVSLRGAKFGGADLRGTRFRGADLTDASLDTSKVDGRTDFRDAVMKGTDFSGLDLSDNDNFSQPPDFSTDPAHRTKFVESRIKGSLLGLEWNCLDLTGTTIVNLRKDLAGLQARQSILTGLNLGASTGNEPFDLQEANFYQSIMTLAQLQRANLIDARFEDVNLQAANLSGADLTRAFFGNAVLGKDANHEAANLSSTALLGTDFGGANLAGVSFDRATIGFETKFGLANLRETTFVEADLTAQDLKEAQLEGANFTGANLTNSNLTGAKLKAGSDRARLDRACLLGADLTGATLEAASLSNAVLSFESGYLYRSDSLRVPYNPTIFPADITDAQTTCPHDDSGPCTGTKLKFKVLPANMTEVRNSQGKLLGYSWSKSESATSHQSSAAGGTAKGS